jgi:hypothetical protein
MAWLAIEGGDQGNKTPAVLFGGAGLYLATFNEALRSIGARAWAGIGLVVVNNHLPLRGQRRIVLAG